MWAGSLRTAQGTAARDGADGPRVAPRKAMGPGKSFWGLKTVSCFQSQERVGLRWQREGAAGLGEREEG